MKQKKLNGSPIVYYVGGCGGNADWLLFLHAAYADHGMFGEQFEFFKNKYNILAVDIIGHGRSLSTEKGDSVDKMSDWIKEIMQAEGIEKVHLTGVSLGAVLVQDFANKYPEAVKSLSCFGGYDINNFDKKLKKGNSAAQMLMMLKAMVSIKWFARANKKISAYTQKAQEEFYEMNIRFPKRSFMYLATLGSMVNKYKPRKRLYPLLIGCGEHDIPAESEAVKMWRESEPDCRTVIFKNAGHCVNMDTPQQFNREMESFWKSAAR